MSVTSPEPLVAIALNEPVAKTEPKRSWFYQHGPSLVGFLVLGPILGFFLLWPAFQNCRDSFQVSGWRPAPAVVTQCYTVQNRNGNGRISRSYRFNYQYTVDDQSYTGWRYSLAFPSGSASSAVELLDAGQKITIYYDPKVPSRSVVDPNVSAWWNFMVLGVSLFLLGTGVFIRYGRSFS